MHGDNSVKNFNFLKGEKGRGKRKTLCTVPHDPTSGPGLANESNNHHVTYFYHLF
jgi:hypothetical protein